MWLPARAIVECRPSMNAVRRPRQVAQGVANVTRRRSRLKALEVLVQQFTLGAVLEAFGTVLTGPGHCLCQAIHSKSLEPVEKLIRDS